MKMVNQKEAAAIREHATYASSGPTVRDLLNRDVPLFGGRQVELRQAPNPRIGVLTPEERVRETPIYLRRRTRCRACGSLIEYGPAIRFGFVAHGDITWAFLHLVCGRTEQAG